MPELSDRVLARSEHKAIPALDRLKMRLKALTTPDELEHFNDSEVLDPGYARQQNDMAAHIGREKPYGRDQEAEMKYRDEELVEQYQRDERKKKDPEQRQKLRQARQEYSDEFMKARREFMKKQKADEKKRKAEEEAKQKTEPPEKPSEAVSREQDRMKKIVEGLRPEAKTQNDPPEDPQQAAMTKALKAQGLSGFDSQRKMVQDILDRAQKDGRPMSMEDAIRQMKGEPISNPSRPGEDQYQDILSKGAKARSERTAEEKPPENPVDPQQASLRAALKAQGMEGMDSQIKMVQDILDKAKKSGRTISVEDAIREMRGEQTTDPSRPDEEQYQKTLSEGAKAKQARTDEPKPEEPEPVDPRIGAIEQALKAHGMEGMGSQIKMIQDILDKAKQGGITMSIEEAIRQMKGEPPQDPSLPKEGDYQDILKKGAQARQEMRDKFPPVDIASASYPNPDESIEPPKTNGVDTTAYTTFTTKAQLFTEEEKRAWEQQQISPTMQENPHVVLNPEAEISGYFGRQNPEYLQLLDKYMQQEGMTTPMHDECEAVVCIPVYTLAEGQVIQHALEQYLYQIDPKQNKDAIDPKKFEIILFLNHPATKREELEKKLGKGYRDGSEKRIKKGKSEVYDTEAVIEQFMKEHPELPIRVMREEFEERVLWGQIIKPLYDVALKRAEERENPTQKDPLILTNDIDLVRMSPHYIRDVIDFFRKNDQEVADGKTKKIDGAVGKIDLAPEGYRRVPELLLSKRFHSYLELQNTEYNHATHGRNTILRGSTLAAIGGPCPYMDNGADGEMGGQIYYARGGDATTIPYLHKAWLETDPRRELKNLHTGVTLAHNWDTWAEMDIYDKNWTELQGDAFDPEKVSKEFLEAEINQTIQHPWYKHHNWGGRVERALSFIGLRNHEHELNKLIFEKGLSQESDEFQKTLASFELTQDDYYWDDNGKLVLKNKDGHVDYHFVDENGQQKIVIDNMTNVKGKLGKYVEEERWNISQRKIDKVAPEHKEEKTGIQARIDKGVEVIRKLSARMSKPKKKVIEEQAEAIFPLPSPESQQQAFAKATSEYRQEFEAARANYQEPQLQAVDANADAKPTEEPDETSAEETGDDTDDNDAEEATLTVENEPTDEEKQAMIEKSRKESDKALKEGGAKYIRRRENGKFAKGPARLDVTQEQWDAAHQEMEDDVSNRETAEPVPAEEKGVQPAETTAEKTQTDYDKEATRFVTTNKIDLRGAELQRFIDYLKKNNRTDMEQAYDDYLKENAPKPEDSQNLPERSGNPITEAALGMAAMAEQGNPPKKLDQSEADALATDIDQTLQAGRRNNAEPWYREFVQDTETLKHMKKPRFFRSLSKEDMAHFDRIMTNSLDRLSDISAYESDASVLLKSASRNLEFAKAICQRNSPARKLLAQKLEDFIRDDFHAMHYMHEYERTVNDNALSLFSLTKRDTSFYKGVLAAFFRNKELHPTELANVLGIPEVRELVKQAVLGMEVKEAPKTT